MTGIPKLTTKAACRVARIDRDRFNEHSAAERFPCAPATIPGRSRLFDPDDMIALWLFRELMDDNLDASTAGKIACMVAAAARENPEAVAISYVQTRSGSASAVASDRVPPPEEWQTARIRGSAIRKVTEFNIADTRELIAHYTEEERSIIGEDD